jgi:hypothetical protein
MTRDELLNIAREAQEVSFGVGSNVWALSTEGLERFAALVTAAEREACALIAEAYEPRCDTCPSGVATAIRARGET